MTVRLVTDSNAMLPVELRERFAITAVPLTVVLDGVAHHEDTLDPVAFCAALRRGATATTSAPSPGNLLAAYESLAAEGATAVLSIHVGANQSATVAAAQVAAAQAPLPVTIVDTGTASFIEGCCVWRAAEVLASGAGIEAAEAAAHRVAASAASVFTIGEIERAQRGGRLRVDDTAGVPVFFSKGPEMGQRGTVRTADEAARLLADVVAEHAGPLRVGVGDADAEEAAVALVATLRALPDVAEVVRYTVGPSVATHTGAGTVGAVFHRLST
ncbi:MAG: DegV family protein [Acidimicrobiales bacterium]